jgi:hypothetical protein
MSAVVQKKFCREVSLNGGKRKTPGEKKLPNPMDFCKRRQERLDR